MKMNLESMPKNITMNYVPDEYFELKTRIHDRLLDLIDLPHNNAIRTHP